MNTQEQNNNELKAALVDIADAAIVMGKIPNGKIGMTIIWLNNYIEQEVQSRLKQFHDEITK